MAQSQPFNGSSKMFSLLLGLLTLFMGGMGFMQYTENQDSKKRDREINLKLDRVHVDIDKNNSGILLLNYKADQNDRDHKAIKKQILKFHE